MKRLRLLHGKTETTNILEDRIGVTLSGEQVSYISYHQYGVSSTLECYLSETIPRRRNRVAAVWWCSVMVTANTYPVRAVCQPCFKCSLYHIPFNPSTILSSLHPALLFYRQRQKTSLFSSPYARPDSSHGIYQLITKDDPSFSDENSSHVHAQNFLQKTYSEIIILLKIFASILVPDINGNIFKMLSLKGWENCVLNPRKDFSSVRDPVRPGQRVTMTMPLDPVRPEQMVTMTMPLDRGAK